MAKEKNCIEFLAEIREVKSKKLITLDKEIIITLNTGDEKAIALALLPSEIMVRVKISEEES